MNPVIRVPHRGYVMAFDTEGGAPFCGRILYISDLVTTLASSTSDCTRQARDAIDDYLETCAELGVEPNTPKG